MTICSITGCGRESVARGWCGSHYSRWRRHGDPCGGGTSQGEPLRFLEETAIPFDGDECLIWPYARSTSGYGNIFYEGKFVRVTRIICERAYGPPPTPHHVAAHSCGKGHLGCVAKRHLRWATQHENMADKIIHGTATRGDSHSTSKLSKEDACKILRLRGEKKPSEIAASFGVSYNTVWMIHSGRHWSSSPGQTSLGEAIYQQIKSRKLLDERYSLTARQSELLSFIREYHEQNDVGPSFDEIMEALGLRSKSSVFRLLTALEESGHIWRLPAHTRSIMLVEGAA